MEVPDARASLLPDDLLLDILRRLEATDVISCAGTCKPWRRAIVSNASTLVPRLDMFVPSLLFGFVTRSHPITRYNGVRLQRTPAAASQPVPPVLPEPEPNPGGYSMIPAPTNCDLREGHLLCTRDGFLLIRRSFDRPSRKKKPRRRDAFNDLCLWNPITGACTFLPKPAASFTGHETYILFTGYDDDDESDVRILAVQEHCKSIDFDGSRRCKYVIRYQLFSAKSGAWGAVDSQELPEGVSLRLVDDTEVVSRGGVVHWLAWLRPSTVALDVATGRTWTTELPQNGREWPCSESVVLGTSRDGRRLSLLWWLQERQQMQVWELTGSGGGGDRWTLQRVVGVRELVPDIDSQQLNKVNVSLNVFCPRSGCLQLQISTAEHDQELPVDIDGDSAACPIQLPDTIWEGCHPYEMDWSSYWTTCLTKMKHF